MVTLTGLMEYRLPCAFSVEHTVSCCSRGFEQKWWLRTILVGTALNPLASAEAERDRVVLLCCD